MLENILHWLGANAELLSSLLGMASAIFLLVAPLQEIRERRHWDGLQNLINAQPPSSARSATTPLDDIERRLVRERLGQHLPHRRKVIGGLLLLFFSFAFDLLDLYN